jgi:hypothetical protein
LICERFSSSLFPCLHSHRAIHSPHRRHLHLPSFHFRLSFNVAHLLLAFVPFATSGRHGPAPREPSHSSGPPPAPSAISRRRQLHDPSPPGPRPIRSRLYHKTTGPGAVHLP